jgi:hypothetical protein
MLSFYSLPTKIDILQDKRNNSTLVIYFMCQEYLKAIWDTESRKIILKD